MFYGCSSSCSLPPAACRPPNRPSSLGAMKKGPVLFASGPFLMSLPSDRLEPDQKHISVGSSSCAPVRPRLQKERRHLMEHFGVANEQDVTNRKVHLHQRSLIKIVDP